MRGKKSDPEFVSQFMAQCVAQGLLTPEEMVKVAKQQIEAIDQRIKEVDQLKQTRSKLLDVIVLFDKPESKIEEAKLLHFFELKYPQECKRICDLLKKGALPVYTSGVPVPEYTFALKQLLEAKIAARVGEQIVRGEKFDDYIKYVFHYTKMSSGDEVQ